jgi:hypothetical protein
MDRIIMPEVVPPVLAEAIAGNPELLKSILENKPEEEVIVGKNCSLDCGNAPTNVKLALCNVTIKVSDDEGKKAEERENQLKLESAALEARINELARIVRVIPRLSENKKLIAWCRQELNKALKELAARRSELEKGAEESEEATEEAQP